MEHSANTPAPRRGSPVALARIAGMFGVAMLATGTAEQSVMSRLVVRGDAGETARRALGSEALFRAGIACGLAMMIAFLLYVTILHRLLERVSKTWALAMLVLAMTSAPIYMLNEANLAGALAAASAGRLDLVATFLDLHRFGNLVAGLFFGLWLLPFGVLVWRSGFYPRLLGALLMAGSPGYVAVFVRAHLTPGASAALWASPLLVLTHVSELAMMLWLLVRGVNAERWERADGAK